MIKNLIAAWFAVMLLVVPGNNPAAAQGLIFTTPSLQGSTVSLCLNDGQTVTFNTSYSGPADSIRWIFIGGSINTASGPGPHTVSYTTAGDFTAAVQIYSGGILDSADTVNVQVTSITGLSFAPGQTVFCTNDPPFALNGVNPPGGIFSGNGVSNGNFDPAVAGIGTHAIQYIAVAGACRDTISTTVSVMEAPDAGIQSTGNPTSYNGGIVYRLCTSNATQTFNFSNSSIGYDSYTIDFGDGNSQSGTSWTFLSHTYTLPGLYTVTLTVNKNNGCSDISVINVFFGTNPQITLPNPGNTIACLGPNGTTYTFNITGTENNSPGTIYTVEFNDGSPNLSFIHPPPATFSHTFTQNSCGFVSKKPYNNAFFVQVTASNPCGASSSSIDPIILSDKPGPDLDVPERACLNQTVTLTNTSDSAATISFQPPDSYTCDDTYKKIWEISPGTYTVISGSTGFRFGSNDPDQWIDGSEILNVQFHQTGVYTVKIITGASALCGIDSVIKNICVDSIPPADFSVNPSPVCSGDTVTIDYLHNILGLCDTTELEWTIIPATGFELLSASAMDTVRQYRFFQSGVYQIILEATNYCGTGTDTAELLVRGMPTLTLPPDTNICGLARIDFSQTGLLPQVNDSLDPVSYSWSVNPNTGWSFESSTSDTSATPLIGFNQFGSYTVTLAVTNSCGTVTDQMIISLTDKPELDSLQDTLVCYNSGLLFVASATGGLPPYTFRWGTAGNTHLSNIDSLQLTSLTQDTDLYVVVTDILGCSDSLYFSVAVADELLVDAGPDQTACYNDTVQLQATVSGGLASYSYQWSPAAGLSSALIADPLRFPLDTPVQYVLQVTDSLGCVSYDSVQVDIYPQPAVDAGADIALCLNNGLYALGGIPSGGSWSGPGVNTAQGTLDPALTGTGNFVLYYDYTDGNGCRFRDSLTANIIAFPEADFSVTPDSGCAPLTFGLYDSSSTGVSHQWYINNILFSTLQNPELTVQNFNNLQDSITLIKLVITAGSGCTDSVTKAVTIFPRPAAGFIVPAEACAADTIFATDTSIFKGSSPVYYWSVSGGSVQVFNDSTPSPSFIFPDFQSGSDSVYTVSLVLISEDGCADTAEQNIIIHSRPVAGFSLPSAACGPVDITPADQSSGSGLTYSWSISPAAGTVITGADSPNPVISLPVSLNDSVTYRVRLLINDENSCSDTISKTYSVYPKPVSGFIPSVTDSCGPITITFLNTSGSGQSGMSRNSMSFSWDFGNGQTSADSVPTATFINPGVNDTSYTVQLVAVNAFGCSDTTTASIRVHPDPEAELQFTHIVACNPFTIDSSVLTAVDYPNANDSLFWQVFDTGNNLLDEDTTVVNYTLMNASDSVYIRLITTSLYGCGRDTSALQLFYTIENPVAGFAAVPDSGCSPLVVSLLDSSSPGVTHQWFLNGNLFSTASDPQITLQNSSPLQDSVISFRLVVTAGSGCTDTAEAQVVLYPRPFADFSIRDTVCASDSLTVSQSSVYKGATAFYHWSTSSSAVVISDSVAVAPWFHFPDNQSGSDSTYSIQMVITSENGCTDTAVRQVIVHSRPTADFSLPAAGCGPLNISPADLSSGNIVQYQWTVSPAVNVVMQGANSSSPFIELPESSADSVVYTVRLNITDDNGCMDSTTRYYTVYPVPEAVFVPSVNDSCGPLTVTLQNTSVPNQSGMDRSSMSFSWDFGNGQTSADSVPSATFTNPGVRDTAYVVQLIATNALGCSDTIADTITVHPDPRAEMNFIHFVDCAPFVIDSTVVTAAHFSEANAGYFWEVLDKNFNPVDLDSGRTGIEYTLNTGGDSVYVRLIAISPYGCSNDTSSIQLFHTIVNPVADFSAVPDSGCSPLAVSLFDSSSAGVSHQWLLNGTLFSTAQNPQLNLQNLSNTSDSIVTVQLIITAGSGCSDSMARNIRIFPKPHGDFSIPSQVCAGDTVQPVANAVFKGVSAQYYWTASSPAITVAGDSSATPSFVFPDFQSGQDSIYTLTLVLTSQDGCMDTVQKNISVTSRPLAAFGLPTPECGPFTVSPQDMSVGSGLSYIWSVTPGNGITLTNAGTPAPVIDFPVSLSDSVIYTIHLRVFNGQGCSDSVSRQYVVYPKPAAGFIPSAGDSCGPLTVIFQNISTPNQSGTDRSSMSFSWDFGNGQTSADSVPSATFTNPGIRDTAYVVQLIATNALGCNDTITDTVTVHPDPRAAFTAATYLDCAPFIIDSSLVTVTAYTEANAAYQWEVINARNGTLISTFTGIHDLNYTLSNPDDSVRVRLIVSSPFGCASDTLEHVFRTVPNPVPGFTADHYQGCHPLTVQISDTSTAGVSHEWFINGILVSTAANPVFTLTNTSFTQDSVYQVKLRVTAGTGCSDSVTQQITVYALPYTGWIANDVCIGDTVTFQDQSLTGNSLASWLWDFGDGFQDTVSDPRHFYTVPGIYTVSLTVTDSRGCSGSFTDSVVVHSLPQPNFTAASACGTDTVCTGQALNLTDISATDSLGGTIIAWSWDVGNNGSVEYTTSSASHIFNDTGFVDISLQVVTQYGCADIIVKSIYVTEAPEALFSVDTTALCGPLDITATDMSTGLLSGYHWELYTPDNNGNRTVIYTSGQQDPNPLPTLQSGFYRDTTYILELTVSNCCGSSSFQQSFTLKPAPVAAILALPDTGCTPLPVTFQLDGLVRGNPDYLVLDFGDGSPADTLTKFFIINPAGDTVWFWGQPTHLFVNPHRNDTTFTVSLTAVNDCGDSTVTLTVLVHPNTVQAFFQATPRNGCEDLTVHFMDNSFGGTHTSWCLDYDTLNNICNQFVAAGPNVTHIYTEPGTYIAAQFVNDGCSYDTAFTQITVSSSPVADYAFNNRQCEGDTVNFTDLSALSTGSITSYQWDFGDGTVSSLPNPSHVFDSGGVFSVCLTVSSSNGCRDSVCYPVEIFDKPFIDFYAPGVCFNRQPVQFWDSSSVNAGTISSSFWDFGDGNSSVALHPQHTYTAPGRYVVTLIHTSSHGCTDSLIQTIEIFPSPVAAFSFSRANGDSCGVPQTVNFFNQSAGAGGYLWDFNYNNQPGVYTSTLINPSFEYTTFGVFEVALIALNANGCSDTSVQTVVIRPNPVAGFFGGPSLDSCAPLRVTFTDTSVYDFSGDGGIVNWYWDFGDGATAEGLPVADHIYTTGGTYTVRLIVETDGGCFDTVSYQNYVHILETPQAGFSASFSSPRTVSFGNTTQFTDLNTVFYWDFGDGSVSNEENPAHTYNVNLFETDYEFEVCLRAVNTTGCEDDTCMIIGLEGYRLEVPNAFAPDRTGVGEASIFLPKGNSLKEYELRIYDKWGNLIFVTTTLDESGIPAEVWDGKHPESGVDLPMGAYVWRIKAIFKDGAIWPGKLYENGTRKDFGTVTLIR